MAEDTRAACLLRQYWRPERVPAATAQFLLVVRPEIWKLASIGDKQPSVTVVGMTAAPCIQVECQVFKKVFDSSILIILLYQLSDVNDTSH